MKEPLKAGDVCKVVGGMTQRKSPNLGLQVTIKHRVYGDHGMDHREFGAMYRCEGPDVVQLDDMGSFVKTGWADFAGIWLQKIEPPKTELGTLTKEELTA